VPSFGDVVRVIEDDKSLDLTASKEGDRCDSGLPTQYTQPAATMWLAMMIMAVSKETNTR
jgi:hypothetical protein